MVNVKKSKVWIAQRGVQLLPVCSVVSNSVLQCTLWSVVWHWHSVKCGLVWNTVKCGVQRLAGERAVDWFNALSCSTLASTSSQSILALLKSICNFFTLPLPFLVPLYLPPPTHPLPFPSRFYPSSQIGSLLSPTPNILNTINSSNSFTFTDCRPPVWQTHTGHSVSLVVSGQHFGHHCNCRSLGTGELPSTWRGPFTRRSKTISRERLGFDFSGDQSLTSVPAVVSTRH